MPTSELTTLDVENYTQGRLHADDPETVRTLAAALGAARRYCGWSVTPAASAVLTVDGPGSALLVLPTLRLIAVTSLTEDGAAVALEDISFSARGLVRKRNHGCWTGEYGGIVATVTHGFDEAWDWQAAVLSAADRGGFDAGGGGELTAIGPFQYGAREAAGSVFTDRERAVLDLYALERAP